MRYSAFVRCCRTIQEARAGLPPTDRHLIGPLLGVGLLRLISQHLWPRILLALWVCASLGVAFGGLVNQPVAAIAQNQRADPDVTGRTYAPAAVNSVLVDLALTPESKTVWVGEIFTVTLEVRADTQQVDGVAAYLNFDPQMLQVVDSSGNPAISIINPGAPLDVELQNTVDNTNGRINYVVGKLSGGRPSGTLAVGAIRFKALAESIPWTEVAFTFSSSDNRQTNVTFRDYILDTESSICYPCRMKENALVCRLPRGQSSLVPLGLLAGRCAEPIPQWSYLAVLSS